jgi:hypothetical protein
MESLPKCAHGPCKNKPKVLLHGYCQKHQRFRIHNEGVAAGKHYCRFFFRGCDSELTADKKTCDACVAKKHEGRRPCGHEGCSYHAVDDEDYCGKHTRDKHRDEEVEKGIRYCDIDRGCLNVCKEGCSSCVTCLAADRKKEKEAFDTLVKRAKHLREVNGCNRLCVMCGKTYDMYKTAKGVESTRCLKCQTAMRKQDERRSDRERNYKRENMVNVPKYYKAYQRSAAKRKYVFELSVEQFKILITQPCVYCDYHKEGEANGIDRVDNNKGYTVENSRSCCEMCNHMKYAYDTEYFLTKVCHIANGTQPEEAFHTTWGHSQSLCTTKYKYYATECASRNISFLLTEDQWDELTNEACYICGFHDTPVGIDRYDNSTRSYTYENCRPCCRPCNLMKFTYSFEELREQCKKIYAKWPDASVFDTIPHLPTRPPTEYEMLIEPEDMECSNIVVYSEEDDAPITNTVEMISELVESVEIAAEETVKSVPPEATPSSSKDRWTTQTLYIDILSNDTAAFLARNAHVLSEEDFKTFADDIKSKKKDEALPLLKTYLNTLRTRRTRAAKRILTRKHDSHTL